MRIKRLREAFFRAFAALSTGETPDSRDIKHINRELINGMRQLNLYTSNAGVKLDWNGAHGGLLPFLSRLTCTASQLLASEEAGRIRMCVADDCAWLFLDNCRNGKRRWCDMKTGATRAKAREHYLRRSALVHGSDPL